MTNKIRWGVISTSNHAAKRVIPAIHASPDGELVAIASRDATKARAFADKLNIPKSYGTYDELLNDPDVDAIYNPLPNRLHKEWTIKAAEVGKHVLCEKPIGLNAAEAKEMVQVFRDAKLKLAEAFQWRHHPQGQKVRQMVRDGVIGDLKFINAGFSFFFEGLENIRMEPDLGGGALYDVGCYPIALTRFMTEDEPISVTAQGNVGPSGIDDLVVATMQFPNGVYAHIQCAFTVPLRRYYEVCGTKGVLKVDYAYNPIGDRPNLIQHYTHDYQLVETIDVGTIDSYTLMVQDFNTAILEDNEPPFPAEDAISNMQVIDAMFQAMKEKATVNVAR
jgi:D-xylose 1-dehydrogenase (NADP+, D-xylono-1,5-lactone-forming)